MFEIIGARSDLHLFGALTDVIHGTWFGTNNVFCGLRTGPRNQQEASYQQGINTLASLWHVDVVIDGVYAEK
jgi:hypothetical protein